MTEIVVTVGPYMLLGSGLLVGVAIAAFFLGLAPGFSRAEAIEIAREIRTEGSLSVFGFLRILVKPVRPEGVTEGSEIIQSTPAWEPIAVGVKATTAAGFALLAAYPTPALHSSAAGSASPRTSTGPASQQVESMPTEDGPASESPKNLMIIEES